MKFTVIIENAGDNFSAYVPDLPGCVATGSSPEDTLSEIKTAIEFHLEGMKLEGLPIPTSTSRSAEVEVEY